MSNPFFETWTTPFGAPPSTRSRPSTSSRPTRRRWRSISAKSLPSPRMPKPASFDNTIAALERSGQLLRRVEMVFGQLASADTNDEMQAVERDMSPLVTRHWNGIFLNAQLFARIDDLYRRRDAARPRPRVAARARALSSRFRPRAAPASPTTERDRFAAIIERLATLGTTFGQNVLADEQTSSSR